MILTRHSIQSFCLAGLALAWLSGCESSNHQNLAANQATSVNTQACGERAHGEYWFELTDHTGTNDTYVCPNGRIGSATHFLEAQFQCEQGQAIATGTTRLDPQPLSHNCDSLAVPPPTTIAPPPTTPQVCTPGATQACSIANGTGQQSCNNMGQWESCQAQSCNQDFKQVENRCERYIYKGSGLFTCNGSLCDLTCGTESRPHRLYRGDKGFCTKSAPSEKVKGSTSDPYKNMSAWIQAEYLIPDGSFVRASTSTVKVTISCDMELRRTGWLSFYNIGRSECSYEASGLEAQVIRRPIWKSGQQLGVTEAEGVLTLSIDNFPLIRKLTKHSNHVDSCPDGSGENYTSCPAVTSWYTNQRSGNFRGFSTVELEVKADLNWTASVH